MFDTDDALLDDESMVARLSRSNLDVKPFVAGKSGMKVGAEARPGVCDSKKFIEIFGLVISAMDMCIDPAPFVALEGSGFTGNTEDKS